MLRCTLFYFLSKGNSPKQKYEEHFSYNRALFLLYFLLSYTVQLLSALICWLISSLFSICSSFISSSSLCTAVSVSSVRLQRTAAWSFPNSFDTLGIINVISLKFLCSQGVSSVCQLNTPLNKNWFIFLFLIRVSVTYPFKSGVLETSTIGLILPINLHFVWTKQQTVWNPSYPINEEKVQCDLSSDSSFDMKLPYVLNC